MKIQLWMRGHEGDSKARVYKTITEQEFVDILAVVLSNDGTRPWERDSTPLTERSGGRAP